MSIDEFKESLEKYHTAIILKCIEPKIAQEITLAVEKEAMMQHSAIFAFGMAPCVQCEECAFPDPCRFPHLARPSMDGLGIDLAKTVDSAVF
ncbi:MAG: DUF2284 domain-containing protein [Desulfomonilaceae bacterium]